MAEQMNHVYTPSDGTIYNARPVDFATAANARLAAEKFIADNGEEAVALRSCWECNQAHVHLIEKTSEFVLNCFGCGKWYFQQTDITIYEDEETDGLAQEASDPSTDS